MSKEPENGVHLADSFNNWGVCTALQWTGPNNSLLPRSTLTSALKQAAQMEKLTTRTAKQSTYNKSKSNYGQSGRFGQQQGSNKSFGTNKSNSNSTSGTSTRTGGAGKQ
jgi:hypothetical protein